MNIILKCDLFKMSLIKSFGDWGLGIGDWGLGPIPRNKPNIPIPKMFNI